jgi:hypothetical protein
MVKMTQEGRFIYLKFFLHKSVTHTGKMRKSAYPQKTLIYAYHSVYAGGSEPDQVSGHSSTLGFKEIKKPDSGVPDFLPMLLKVTIYFKNVQMTSMHRGNLCWIDVICTPWLITVLCLNLLSLIHQSRVFLPLINGKEYAIPVKEHWNEQIAK